MKVWHIVDSLEVGGAETMVTTLCLEQVQQGLRPSVHCLARGGKLAEKLKAEGIPVFVYGTGSLTVAAFVMWRCMHALGTPDVLHAHNEAATIVGAALKRKANRPKLIATRHGMVPPGQYMRREVKFWLAARCCDFVVAVCATAHRNLERGPFAMANKIVTIYNCAAPAQRTESVCRFSAPGEFAIVNVARHVPEKGLDHLLRAFALLREHDRSVKLILAGAGALSGELKQLAATLGIAADVLFLGERSDVGDILAATDLFVLSSSSEGLPIALLEAMAAGIPQVVTRVGGMPEVVEMAQGGAVVPAADTRALAQAMRRFREDENYRRECGQRARECYREKFTPEKMAEAYLSLYGK